MIKEAPVTMPFTDTDLTKRARKIARGLLELALSDEQLQFYMQICQLSLLAIVNKVKERLFSLQCWSAAMNLFWL